MGTAILGSLLGSTALKSNLTGFGRPPGDEIIDSGLTTESAVESSAARPPPALPPLPPALDTPLREDVGDSSRESLAADVSRMVWVLWLLTSYRSLLCLSTT